MIFIFLLLLDHTWLLVPLQLALGWHILEVRLVSKLILIGTLNYWLQINIQVTRQVHKANGEFW